MSIRSIQKTISSALDGVLDDEDAQELLKSYGVPVAHQRVVHTVAEALKAAEEMGYPVVVKGMGKTLLHKTERRLVHGNCFDGEAVKRSVTVITENAAHELEGIMIQPHIAGSREFMAGLFRDNLFGPVVMFGIGGIAAEVFADISMRLAPLDEHDIDDMMTQLNSRALLDGFRGEKAVDRKAIARILTAISSIAMDNPAISEIDINPLIADANGTITAVDALIIKNELPEIALQAPVASHHIHAFFHPRSIAFIGASAQMGKWGHMVPSNTIAGGFAGNVFLVNPKGGKIAGREVYKNVVDIPAPIDVAVITIPAHAVFGLIPQLKEKDVRYVLMITSGFGEAGSEGKSREKELVDKAREAGMVILGPNTMGICNPHISFYCTGSPVWPRPGGTAVVSQSGNMGVQLLAFAEQQAIGIRSFCGSGNESMITIEDYIEELEGDDVTETVMLYVESVKNGRRFFENARRLSCKKPIVLLKGGQSGAGNRAAASHTGAMASNTKVFNAVCQQAGIVTVDKSMDLLDLTAAFASLPLPRGNRIAIMTLGGGWGVVTADLCARYGLDVPDLTQDVVASFDELLPSYWSRVNPVDIVGEYDTVIPPTIIEKLLAWDGCDAVINLGIMGRRIFVDRLAGAIEKADHDYSQPFLKEARAYMTQFEETYAERIAYLMGEYDKPVYGVSLLTDEKDKTVYRFAGCRHSTVFYRSPEQAVKACAKMYQYYTFLNRCLQSSSTEGPHL